MSTQTGIPPLRVRMPQLEPYGPFQAPDPVIFTITGDSGATLQKSVDGAAWTSVITFPTTDGPHPSVTHSLGPVGPGPHQLRLKQFKGAQYSIITERPFYVKP